MEGGVRPNPFEIAKNICEGQLTTYCSDLWMVDVG